MNLPVEISLRKHDQGALRSFVKFMYAQTNLNLPRTHWRTEAGPEAAQSYGAKPFLHAFFSANRPILGWHPFIWKILDPPLTMLSQ